MFSTSQLSLLLDHAMETALKDKNSKPLSLKGKEKKGEKEGKKEKEEEDEWDEWPSDHLEMIEEFGESRSHSVELSHGADILPPLSSQLVPLNLNLNSNLNGNLNVDSVSNVDNVGKNGNGEKNQVVEKGKRKCLLDLGNFLFLFSFHFLEKKKIIINLELLIYFI